MFCLWAYSDSKYLAKRPISDKVLKDKFYEIAISLKYDGYQRGLLSLVYNFFYEKTESGAIATSKVRESVNEELSQELHKLVIKNFKRRDVYASFKDNIWAADSADMGSLPCFNHDVKFCRRFLHQVCFGQTFGIKKG